MMNDTMEVRRPRVRNTTDRFESQILPYFRRKSKQLGELLPDLYLHGLATGAFANSRAACERKRDQFVRRYEKNYPKAAETLLARSDVRGVAINFILRH